MAKLIASLGTEEKREIKETDTVILESLNGDIKETEKPVITMSMGKTGVLSRLYGEVTGSAVTFAAGIRASAPGQIPVKRMRDTLMLLHESFT